MKINKVTITEDNTFGAYVSRTTKFINMSSLAPNAAQVLLSRISNLSSRIDMISITGNIVFNSQTGQPIQIRKAKMLVNIIVDSDDKRYNIKIGNICKLCKVVVMNIIVFEPALKSYKKQNTKPGEVVRLANFQHTTTVMKAMNGKHLTGHNYRNISKATILSTKDDRCGSIAGIKLFLNINTIPFDIEMVNVSYAESWLTTTKTGCSMILKDSSEVRDRVPGQDQNWQLKTGYCDYIMTDKGAKRFMINHNVEKTGIPWLIQEIKRVLRQVYDVIAIRIKQLLGIKQTETKVSTSFVSNSVLIANGLAALAESTIPLNASKDIKIANKIIAKQQTNKMLARSGTSGSKEILIEKMSDAYNAYMAGVTSFGVSDAIVSANNYAITRYQSRRQIMISIVTLMIVVVCLMTGQSISLAVAMTTIVMNYFMNILRENKIFYLLNVIMATSFIVLLTQAAFLLVEMTIKDRKTAPFRSIFYLVTTCLTLLI